MNEQATDDPLEPLIHPALPSIANYYFQPKKIEEYTWAMADILCWLQGYQAAGGIYGPASIESLRNLNDALRSVQNGQSTSDQSHHKLNEIKDTKK